MNESRNSFVDKFMVLVSSLAYIILVDALQHLGLFIRRHVKGKKNSLKPYSDLFIKIKQPKTASRPIRSLTVKRNNIDSAIIEILRIRQKKLTTSYNRITCASTDQHLFITQLIICLQKLSFCLNIQNLKTLQKKCKKIIKIICSLYFFL